jgi:hypothetical protein
VTENVFDQAGRYVVKSDPEDFLRWLLPGLPGDVRFERWLDTHTIPFPGEPDRRCDTVAELVHAQGLAAPWALVNELQTRPDAEILDRLLEYLARARRELRHGPYRRDKYQLGATLINLTGTTRTSSLEMVLAGEVGIEFHWSVRVRNLSEEDAVTVLADVASGQRGRWILSWIPLMRGADGEAVQAEWKKQLAAEPERRCQGQWAHLAHLFADLVGLKEAWGILLEDWAMEESRVVAEWNAKARREVKREDLLTVLRSRFKGNVPAAIVEVVRGQNDFQTLSQWFNLAVECPTPEELHTAFGMS